MKIFYTDLKEKNNFEKFDEQFIKIFGNEEKHIYVYKRVKNNSIESYEVIKGVKHMNPDGNYVFTYPSTEQFGLYGFYIMGYDKDYAINRIIKHLDYFDENVCKEFKNSNIQL